MIRHLPKLCISTLLIVSSVIASQTGQEVLEISRATEVNVVRRYPTSARLLEDIQRLNLDVWWRNSSVVDVYFPQSPPLELQEFQHVSEFHPSLDVPLTISAKPGLWNLTSLLNCTFHDVYHPLFEIDQFMKQLAKNFKTLVKLKKIGHSAEGREMYGLYIRRKDTKGKKQKRVKKKAIVIQGPQHAREWIASATALYIAHALVVDSNQTYSVTKLLDIYDFYIVPSPNPDGYEYTWSSDRFWYKNRMNLGPGQSCKGIDMNRNWGYQWLPDSSLIPHNDTNVAPDTCSHWYPGSRPFEAPEVNNIANFISVIPRKSAFIDLRNYGQMISSPFSYSCDKLPAAAEDQLEAALGAAAALGKVWGTHMVTGTLCEMLYSAPGNVVDWMYSTAGIRYSYAVHLRDTGTFGYALPPSHIRPTGQETAKMLEYLAGFIHKRGY